MGTKSRRASAPLIKELYENPARFEFFQAVRLLSRLRTDRESVGRDNDPDRELVRFRSDLSYAFPTGDIRSITPGGIDEDAEELPLEELQGERPADEMAVNFIGIATPNSFGSLPISYVDEIRGQERDKNFAMRDFLDLFNHRLISLFYRAWERVRIEVLYELGEHSPFESALRAIIGVEGDVHGDRLPLDPRDLLARAGLLAMRPGPATAIEGLVTSLFQIPARVHQFLPAWFEIDPADRTRLGLSNTVLGESFNLGSEVCLSQYRFKVELGPMDYATYRSLLPQGDAFCVLSSVIRLAVGPEFDFELSLVLQREEVPELRLGRADEMDETAARLGWSSWLRTEPLDRDAADAVFTPSLVLEEARDSMETRA